MLTAWLASICSTATAARVWPWAPLQALLPPFNLNATLPLQAQPLTQATLEGVRRPHSALPYCRNLAVHRRGETTRATWHPAAPMKGQRPCLGAAQLRLTLRPAGASLPSGAHGSCLRLLSRSRLGCPPAASRRPADARHCQAQLQARQACTVQGGWSHGRALTSYALIRRLQRSDATVEEVAHVGATPARAPAAQRILTQQPATKAAAAPSPAQTVAESSQQAPQAGVWDNWGRGRAQKRAVAEAVPFVSPRHAGRQLRPPVALGARWEQSKQPAAAAVCFAAPTSGAVAVPVGQPLMADPNASVHRQQRAAAAQEAETAALLQSHTALLELLQTRGPCQRTAAAGQEADSMLVSMLAKLQDSLGSLVKTPAPAAAQRPHSSPAVPERSPNAAVKLPGPECKALGGWQADCSRRPPRPAPRSFLEQLTAKRAAELARAAAEQRPAPHVSAHRGGGSADPPSAPAAGGAGTALPQPLRHRQPQASNKQRLPAWTPFGSATAAVGVPLPLAAKQQREAAVSPRKSSLQSCGGKLSCKHSGRPAR